MKSDYVWREPYQAATLEIDRDKLPKRIQAAKNAIDARLHKLQQQAYGGAPEERQAISDALTSLNALRRELERRL